MRSNLSHAQLKQQHQFHFLKGEKGEKGEKVTSQIGKFWIVETQWNIVHSTVYLSYPFWVGVNVTVREEFMKNDSETPDV